MTYRNQAIAAVALFLLLCAAAAAQTQVGPNGVLVKSQFGGQIFGFDIDQNGTEGILSEAKDISGGKVQAAVETFDQATGKILKVVTMTQSQDDFLTLGVTGTSVGLVEREHVISFLNVQRVFFSSPILLPPTSSRAGGRPPLTAST